MGRKIWLLLLAPSLAWIGLCPRARRPRRQVAVRGATVDVPPPPSQASEGGGGDGYEIRFVDNQERQRIAQQWLTVASQEEREVLEQKVLPFRSTQYFTGKSRLCIGAFVGETCQGLGLTEVRMDIQDLAAFFMDNRVLRVLALVTRPRVQSEAAPLILQAAKQLADETGYRADFQPLEEQSSGRYWVLARSLFDL
ncbi:unnamed protein product [Effrenium voratum]|uniref:Uncharacterized protein n=1 Tax=Effrenium voratum TaxID=2562239 RepID=A0AA36JHT9_9DINO|nr:unnamed protein product [Effrenium voratum]